MCHCLLVYSCIVHVIVERQILANSSRSSSDFSDIASNWDTIICCTSPIAFSCRLQGPDGCWMLAWADLSLNKMITAICLTLPSASWPTPYVPAWAIVPVLVTYECTSPTPCNCWLHCTWWDLKAHCSAYGVYRQVIVKSAHRMSCWDSPLGNLTMKLTAWCEPYRHPSISRSSNPPFSKMRGMTMCVPVYHPNHQSLVQECLSPSIPTQVVQNGLHTGKSYQVHPCMALVAWTTMDSPLDHKLRFFSSVHSSHSSGI